jgi:hypothetical protein
MKPRQIVSLFLLLCTLARAEKYTVESDLGGIESRYTPLLKILTKSQWPPPIQYKTIPQDTVQLTRLNTPGEDFYVGTEIATQIQAPFSRVIQILDSLDTYQKFFPGYEEISQRAQDENKFLSFWEQYIPIFFIPNVKFELAYVIDKSEPKRVIYRYQLTKADDLKECDGIVVVEDEGETTRYTEYDFGNADYGFLKTFAPRRIWKDGLRVLWLTVYGIKMRAEHPDWEFKKITDSYEELTEKIPLENVMETPKTFYFLEGIGPREKDM